VLRAWLPPLSLRGFLKAAGRRGPSTTGGVLSAVAPHDPSAREVDRAVVERDPQRDRIFVRYVLPAIALVALVFLVPKTWSAVEAATGRGSPGDLTLSRHVCLHNMGCHWYGEFRSDDGEVVRHFVLFVGHVPGGVHVGDRVRARDTGDSESVFSESGSTRWRGQVLGVAVLAGYLVGWAVWVVWALRRLWRRGRVRPAPHPASSASMTEDMES
jgi:hypothetical protein